MDPIKSFEAPATINSASLHPEKEFLVAGGEDFKLYKYDYNSGEELGELSSFTPLKWWSFYILVFLGGKTDGFGLGKCNIIDQIESV